MRFSIILGYKDREPERLQRCLASLANQAPVAGRHEIVLADYGSAPSFAAEAQRLCEQLATQAVPIRYRYLDAAGLFFNRSGALNYGAEVAKGEYFVFGDIDLIYPTSFLQALDALAAPDLKLNYRCRLATPATKYDPLPAAAELESLPLSQDTGLGLSVVPANAYHAAEGYNEFYCLWGVEDLDFQDRCMALGMRHAFAPAADVWTLHQWHPHAVGALPTRWYDWLWEHYNRYKDRPRPPFNEVVSASAHAGIRPARDAHARGSGWEQTFVLDPDLPYALARLADSLYTRPAGTVLRAVGQAPVFTSTLHRAAAKANALLARLTLGYRISAKEMADFELEPFHKMRDALYYFILLARPYLQDYYLHQEGSRIEVVFVIKEGMEKK